MRIPNISTKQRLEELKASTGLTDQEIGDLVGLHQSNVWRLRNGAYRKTTDEVGIRIANLHAELVNRKQQSSQ